MKYITVKLTDSQLQYILGLLLVDQFELEKSLDTLPNKNMYSKALAFTKRLKKLLVSAKIS